MDKVVINLDELIAMKIGKEIMTRLNITDKNNSALFIDEIASNAVSITIMSGQKTDDEILDEVKKY